MNFTAKRFEIENRVLVKSAQGTERYLFHGTDVAFVE